MRKRSGEARENRHVRGREPSRQRGPRWSEEDLLAKVTAGEVNFVAILDCVQDLSLIHI